MCRSAEQNRQREVHRLERATLGVDANEDVGDISVREVSEDLQVVLILRDRAKAPESVIDVVSSNSGIASQIERRRPLNLSASMTSTTLTQRRSLAVAALWIWQRSSSTLKTTCASGCRLNTRCSEVRRC